MDVRPVTQRDVLPFVLNVCRRAVAKQVPQAGGQVILWLPGGSGEVEPPNCRLLCRPHLSQRKA
jgi:hypothetical protein